MRATSPDPHWHFRAVNSIFTCRVFSSTSALVVQFLSARSIIKAFIIFIGNKEWKKQGLMLKCLNKWIICIHFFLTDDSKCFYITSHTHPFTPSHITLQIRGDLEFTVFSSDRFDMWRKSWIDRWLFFLDHSCLIAGLCHHQVFMLQNCWLIWDL